MYKPNAEHLHDPASGQWLVKKAQVVVGSQKALAARVGMSCEHLRLLANGAHSIKYPLQYMLEVIIANDTSPQPDKTLSTPQVTFVKDG